jgi:hypothetical protein
MSKDVSLRFGLGVDQCSPEIALLADAKTGQSSARRIVNLDVTNTGPLVRRTGSVQILNDDAHSLWCADESTRAYFVSGSTLYSFDGTIKTSLVTGLTPGFTCSYAQVSDDVYWSNGVQSGVLVGGTASEIWGTTETTGLLGQTYMPQVRGSIVRHYKGRLYAVDGRVVWATDPQDYRRVDMARGFIMLESEVTLFEPVSNGIFVGTQNEGVRFLAGNDFTQFQLLESDSLPAVRGSGLGIDAAIFDAPGRAAIWMTTAGWVLGTGDGMTKRLTDTMLALPTYASATSMIRKVDGMDQIVSFAKGGSESAGASDSVTSEVIRNGVLLV